MAIVLSPACDSGKVGSAGSAGAGAGGARLWNPYKIQRRSNPSRPQRYM